MSCEDFEINIYTYAELTPSERSLLEVHLQTCQHCSALFNKVQQAQDLISRVAKEKVNPPHVARLTSHIMAGIATPAKPTLTEFVNKLLLSSKSKYVLSVLSSVLLLIFFIESLDSSILSKAPKTESFANTVILNAKIFRENFSHRKEKQALFADCRSPFQSNQNYLNCVKSKLK